MQPPDRVSLQDGVKDRPALGRTHAERARELRLVGWPAGVDQRPRDAVPHPVGDSAARHLGPAAGHPLDPPRRLERALCLLALQPLPRGLGVEERLRLGDDLVLPGVVAGTLP